MLHLDNVEVPANPELPVLVTVEHVGSFRPRDIANLSGISQTSLVVVAVSDHQLYREVISGIL